MINILSRKSLKREAKAKLLKYMLKNIFNTIPFVTAFRAREYIGITISGNNLKAAHIKVTLKKVELINIASHGIAGMADSDIAKIIKGYLNEFKAKNAHIISVIPSHAVITKNIEIPSTEPREIREIINLQAGRHTPYSREEIIVDYIELGTYKGSYTKILLVIVTASSIKKQLEMLDKSGIRPERVVFAMEGIGCFAQKSLQVETTHTPVTIIHVDESFSDFAVIFKHKPVFLRSIPMGAQHIAGEKEKYEAKFIEELKKSLEAYQSEDIDKIPQTIVLTGAIEELSGWETILTTTFNFPAKYVSYFKSIAIAGPAFLAVSSLPKRVSFLDILAPLCMQEEIKVTLIPEEIKLRISLEARGRDLIKTGVLTFAIFIFAFFLLLTIMYTKNSYLRKLDMQYHSLNQEAEGLKKDLEKNDLIKDYILNHGFSIELLAALYELMPLDTELNDVRFEKQGKLSLRGSAESMSTVFSLADTMRKSKYFTDIKIGPSSRRKENAKDVTDFEITSSFNKQLD